VVIGWLDPYIVEHYRLEIANDVFNDVGTFGLIALPCRTWSAMLHRAVGSPDTVAVSGEWSIVLALHCSCIVATYQHVLQALTTVPAHTSCRLIMALMLSALKMCSRVLGTGEPCSIERSASLFFMLEAHDPHSSVGRVAAKSPPTGR
jgi:hypothetical protein